MSVPQITLYDHPVSSFAQKVRILLREKGLPYVPVSPRGPDGSATARFAEISPRGELPCLEHAGAAIFDSTVIAEYLEDAFPQAPAMLPPREDPAGRARVRMVDNVANTSYEAANWGWGEVLWMGRAGEEGSPLYAHLQAEARRQTADLQAWLSTRLAEAGGEYFGGAHGFGLADATAVVMVHRSAHYGFAPAAADPRVSLLHAWYLRCCTRPAVAQTLREFDDSWPMMPQSRAAFQSGQRQRQYRDHRLEWLVKSGGLSIVQEGIEKKNVRFNWPDAKLGDAKTGDS